MKLLAKTIELITNDPMRMDALKTHQSLNLKDSWIGAGFIRNKIWDHMHGFRGYHYKSDIDVLYFDPTCNLNAQELEIRLNNTTHGITSNLGDWSVKNQAVMHKRNKDQPYKDTEDAMRYWVETCTSVGIRLNKHNQLEIIAPFGLEDIYNLVLKPTHKFKSDLNYVFINRISKKNWQRYWPKLTVIN
ncbi:nucleotidyltransferase family protein [Curvivirga aplysinae]|uniref:nucleotidyltransferase family protein n=1 Tax=Curvivirga aplysinae TaxID=2529852 RepID=UPI0012BD3055|nr:nucleotidyltransferase family protein [Curvivirga aplysinae]MTI08519.1 nucleotidyltransferase family protein [Curvivirga aplysinae]